MVLSAEAFRDYVESHREDIFEEMFLSFKSSSLLTHYSDIKGKEIVPVSSTDSSNTFQKWKELNVNDGRQSVDLGVAIVESFRAQFHERYVPERLEKGYFGHLRKSGQDPRDFPFEAFVLMQLVKASNQFQEKALWNAVADGSSQNAMTLFDGFLKQLADAITAGDITPQVYGTPYRQKYKEETIPTGFTSILDIVEGIAESIPDEMKPGGAHIYMSNKLKTMYNQSYRNVHGTAPTTSMLYDINRTIVDGTDDEPIYIHGIGGLSGSQRIMATKMENAIFAYDDAGDKELFNTQYILNVLHIFGTFRIGANFIKKDDNWIQCNELT